MKRIILIGVGVIGVIVVVVLVKVYNRQKSSAGVSSSHTTQTTVTKSGVTYDQTASKSLTGGNCSGAGSVPIIPPMPLDQVSSILPYGLMTGGHVTPIDHQYYNGLDQMANRDTYDVVAPADGVIVDIQHRGSKINTPLHTKNVPSSDEYRYVFMHSCSFLTYVDLVTSVDSSVLTQLSGWDPVSRKNFKPVTVKQGQVIGHIGGQTLDFAVWDLSQPPLPGLLVRQAYDNAEAWKVFTAPTTKFLKPDMKAATIAKYVRAVDPIDGKIDYDQEGKLIGTWFLVGSNGYDGGRVDNRTLTAYWGGHLAFAPNFVVPSVYTVSIGSYSNVKVPPAENPDQGSVESSGAQQFGIDASAPDPATVDVASGMVKYELFKQQLKTASGADWHGDVAHGIKAVNVNTPMGVMLVQVTGPHTMKAEVFPGKKASDVSAFDDNVRLYNRGDDAKPMADTRT